MHIDQKPGYSKSSGDAQLPGLVDGGGQGLGCHSEDQAAGHMGQGVPLEKVTLLFMASLLANDISPSE